MLQPAPAFWFLTDAELFGWGKPKPRRPAAAARGGARGLLRRRAAGRLRGAHRARHRPLPGPDQDARGRRRARVPAGRVRAGRPALRARAPGRPAGALRRRGRGDAHRCTAWAPPIGNRSKQRARRAVAEIADDLLELYAAREVVQGHAFSPDAAVAARAGGQLPLRRDRGPAGRHRGGQARHGAAAAHGPADLRRRGLRQDRGGAARRLQGRHGRQAGRRAGADDRPGAAALHQLQPPAGGLPRHRRDALALPDVRRSRIASSAGWRTAASTWSSARTAC